MNTRFGRRLFLSVVLAAVMALPAASLLAKSSDRPALAKELAAARSHITEITPTQAEALMAQGGTVFVDVRTQAEWNGGHLPGAKHLDRGMLEFKVERAIPDKSTPIVTYCKSGARGALATQTLMAMGYTNVRNLAGGFLAWEKAGYQVAK